MAGRLQGRPVVFGWPLLPWPLPFNLVMTESWGPACLSTCLPRPLPAVNASSWLLYKLGQPISPLEVVLNGSQALHAVGDEGVSVDSVDGRRRLFIRWVAGAGGGFTHFCHCASVLVNCRQWICSLEYRLPAPHRISKLPASRWGARRTLQVPGCGSRQPRPAHTLPCAQEPT